MIRYADRETFEIMPLFFCLPYRLRHLHPAKRRPVRTDPTNWHDTGIGFAPKTWSKLNIASVECSQCQTWQAQNEKQSPGRRFPSSVSEYIRCPSFSEFYSKTGLLLVSIWIISYGPHGQQVLQGATSQTLQPLQQVGRLSTLAVYNSMVNILIADSCHEETTINNHGCKQHAQHLRKRFPNLDVSCVYLNESIRTGISAASGWTQARPRDSTCMCQSNALHTYSVLGSLVLLDARIVSKAVIRSSSCEWWACTFKPCTRDEGWGYVRFWQQPFHFLAFEELLWGSGYQP